MYMENNTEKKPRKEEKIQKIKEREKERQLLLSQSFKSDNLMEINNQKRTIW